jgi:hypothetical protein
LQARFVNTAVCMCHPWKADATVTVSKLPCTYTLLRLCLGTCLRLSPLCNCLDRCTCLHPASCCNGLCLRMCLCPAPSPQQVLVQNKLLLQGLSLEALRQNPPPEVHARWQKVMATRVRPCDCSMCTLSVLKAHSKLIVLFVKAGRLIKENAQRHVSPLSVWQHVGPVPAHCVASCQAHRQSLRNWMPISLNVHTVSLPHMPHAMVYSTSI